MGLNPLSLLILLFFAAVVTLALTVWFLLTLREPGLELKPPHKAITPQPAQAVPADLKNDDFRGAKAKAKPTVPAPERPPPGPTSKRDDAFERFIKSKNDELEF